MRVLQWIGETDIPGLDLMTDGRPPRALGRACRGERIAQCKQDFFVRIGLPEPSDDTLEHMACRKCTARKVGDRR